MKYMGSKAKHAKEILPIILKDRKPEQWYVEPFVGGGNIIDKVSGHRLGADSNEFVICALETIRDKIDLIPKSENCFNIHDYKSIRSSNPRENPLTGYAAFALSFGGKFFGGWCRGKSSDGKQRDYVNEQYRAAKKQSPLLGGVDLICCKYQDLIIPPNSLIYCDPPYDGATGYKDRFDSAAFWQWCRDKKAEGHTIFVSEYEAPEDFVCVWEKKVSSSLTKDTGSKKAIERLFAL